MAQDIINDLQNISYSGKDFQTVYPELLRLVKELTSKWDPSTSNESDPGVILIKLLALLEDKLNYNVDKNVLECYPLSVTQERNARPLFEQLGYYMKWYLSATTDVSLKWIGDNSEDTYTIPAFTMVSDSDSSIIYTLVGPATGDTTFKVGSQKLKANGEIISFKAIQGIAVQYDIGGNTTITAADLDADRRLYFDDTFLSENGIFITNVGLNNYSDWIKKDNLLVEDLGRTYYKFGVTPNGKYCYLEFPTDADVIFKDGIQITYIQTLGEAGNIYAGGIEKFYNNLIPVENDAITLTSDNVKVFNVSSAVNGADTETINAAYSNYKKTVGTFKTLVTLRDYINSINLSGLVSNNFVCDRTNDIQTCYKIQALINNLNQVKVVIEDEEAVIQDINGANVTISQPRLNAYDLKLYVLQYVDNRTTLKGFNDTFGMCTNSDLANVKSYISDEKLISHDYKAILPSTTDSCHFCMFKNKYPIKAQIVTQYKLTGAQASEVLENIKKAIYENLNSTELNFGDRIEFDYIYEIILNADTRIKNVILDNIDYTTYAVYFDGETYNEIEISSEDEEPVEMTCYNGDDEVQEDYATIDPDKFIEKSGYIRYEKHKFIYDGTNWYLDNSINKNRDNYKFARSSSGSRVQESRMGIVPLGNPSYLVLVDLAEWGITVLKTPKKNDYIEVNVSLKTQFRGEIYAKSVLAGITQLFVKDEEFDYKLNQKVNEVIRDISHLKGDVNITFEGEGKGEDVVKLRDNEVLQLYAPNLIDKYSYSNYVKFEYNLLSDVKAESDYELAQNEYILFYWKEDDDENSVYKYACYGKGNIFKPSFAITKNTSLPTGQALSTLMKPVMRNGKQVLYSSSDTTGEMSQELSDKIKELTKSTYILSGSKKVIIRYVNQVTLESADYYCYWITNNKETDSNGISRYTLFEKNEVEKILGANEYFIYSNSSLTSLSILGSGSKITRSGYDLINEWKVIAIDLEDILTNGAEPITSEDVWFTLTKGQIIKLTENQFINLNPGCSVTLKPKFEITGNWKVVFNSSGIEVTPSDYNINDFDISYQTSAEGAVVSIQDVRSQGYGGWNGCSILNIYISPDTSMKLLSNQKVIYKKLDGTDGEIIGEDKPDEQYYYPQVLLASSVIENSTSDLLPVYTIDDYGNFVLPSIYSYKEYISHDKITYTSNGGVVVTFDKDEGEGKSVSFNFSLPNGEYILPATNGSDALESLVISLDDVPLHTMYSEEASQLNKTGDYFLYVKLDDEGETKPEHTIKIYCKGNNKQISISLSNIYKYIKPSYYDDLGEQIWMKDVDFNKYQKLIVKLDKNHIFNYTYVVPSDTLIEDPLEASSFNNSMHIFNPYTICQLNTTSNSSLKILGKLNS